MNRNDGGIDWRGINQLTATQGRSASQLVVGRPYVPPVPTETAPSGLALTPTGLLAGAALGFVLARFAGWPPIAGALGGALAGGVLIR